MPFKKNKEQEPLTPDEILAKLEHYCAYRERSPKEVWKKLREFNADERSASQIYSVLEGDGYVNEERFAEAYTGGKFRVNRWGKRKIRQGLKEHGIGEPLIHQALKTIDEADYLDTLKQLMEKKRSQLKGDEKVRDKVLAYMVRAGFEHELIFSYL